VDSSVVVQPELQRRLQRDSGAFLAVQALVGTPDRIRTCGLRLRRPMNVGHKLCPTRMLRRTSR